MSVALAAGCDLPNDPPGVDGGLGGGGGGGGTVLQQDYAGDYTSAGSWDLSSPFGGDGLGGFVADLMINQVIQVAGIPSAFEDQARNIIAGEVRQPVADYVNGVVPPEMYTSSETMMTLQEIFSDVAVDGTLSLASSASPEDFTGTDTVLGLAITYEGETVTVSMPELLEGAVSVAGDFTGAAGADTIEIGQHELQVRFGMLIAIVARDTLGIDVFDLGDQALTAIDCSALVDEITGGGESYTVSVGESEYSVSAASLEAECDSLKTRLADRAFAIFSRDLGIRLGGPARLGDADGDLVSDTVTAEPDYGGVITSLPVPVELQVSASFVATRSAAAAGGAGRREIGVGSRSRSRISDLSKP